LSQVKTGNGKKQQVSLQVFLGGIPWDIEAETIAQTFRKYGQLPNESLTMTHQYLLGEVEVKLPDEKSPPRRGHAPSKPMGFVYLVFSNEESVHKLLNACKIDDSGEKYYHSVQSRTESRQRWGKQR